MISLLAAASLLAAQPDCAAPAGTDALLARPERILVVGELHGTTETPAAFLAMVCEAAAQGPVTVGLEMPETDRPLLDMVMAAPDEESAIRLLRAGDFGDSRRDDSRHSQAMFDMIIGFRRLRAAGHDIVIRPFAARMSVVYDAEARGVILGAVEDGAYDGVLALGPTTASPPAARRD